MQELRPLGRQREAERYGPIDVYVTCVPSTLLTDCNYGTATAPLSNDIVGGGQVSLDNGKTWAEGPPAVFETHLVLDNTTQVWTWNWNAFSSRAKSSLCFRLHFQQGRNSSTTLPARCFSLPVSWVSRQQQRALTAPSPPSVLQPRLLFGNWTAACSRSVSPACRLLGHVAVDAASAPIPIAQLSGRGLYTLNAGKTWTSQGGKLTWLSYFDRIDGEAGVLSQRFHWGVDVSFPRGRPPKEVCYSIKFEQRCVSLTFLLFLLLSPTILSSSRPPSN